MCVERLAHGKQGIFSRILFWKKGGGGSEGSVRLQVPLPSSQFALLLPKNVPL